MVAAYRKARDAAAEIDAEENVIRLQSDLIEAERQAAHLVVRSPAQGVVIAPPAVPEPTLNAVKERLPTWHGTPLDPQNRGALLEPRTHLCSIAPVDLFRAVLMIDQADRDDVTLGRDVRLKLEHMPDVKLTGTVQEISDRHREFVPPALSNKYGGSLATVADSQGREKLAGTIVYQVVVQVDQDPTLLKSGMRGQARFIIAQRSAVQWLWRVLRRTFHFRL